MQIKIPKISCLMVTTGRLGLLQRSVGCYVRQTYPNRELVILSQGKDADNQAIRSYVDSLGRDDIQFVSAPSTLTLGAMRNLSIEVSTGTILCQWDDDDIHHPHRLVTQFNALSQDEVSASLYMEHLKYFETTGELYWIDWSIEVGEDRRHLAGTAMFRKSLFYQAKNILYPEHGVQSTKEEDWNVLQKFCEHGRIASVLQGYQYIYTFHGDNTYWLEHHRFVLKKRVYAVEELLYNRRFIEDALRSSNIDKKVNVRSLEGTAFVYDPSDFCSEGTK